MEPDCYEHMNHCSQLVKGMTTVANLLRVVTTYPLGTQSGPLWFPYGCLTPPLWLPYAPLMVALHPPYGCLTPPLWLPYAPLMVVLWSPYGPLPPPLKVAQTSPGQGAISIYFH